MYNFIDSFEKYEDDSALIQAAIDKAAKNGEQVIIPRMNPRTGKSEWVFPRAVKLYSGSVVCLDNCTIRHAENSFDNLFKNSNARTVVASTPECVQKNIIIYGRGNAVLCGGKPNGHSENSKIVDLPVFVNSAIHFHNVSRFTVKDIKIVNSRYWGITCHFCTDGEITGICFSDDGKGTPSEAGDTYNITVRNVITRARCGVFISHALCDSLIDNIRMRDDGGTAVYFREGIFERLRINNLSYTYGCRHPETEK